MNKRPTLGVDALTMAAWLDQLERIADLLERRTDPLQVAQQIRRFVAETEKPELRP